MSPRRPFIALVLVIVATTCAGRAAAAPKPPISKAYASAVDLFKDGKVQEARDAWAKLLDERRAELTPAQVDALEGRLAKADEALSGGGASSQPASPVTSMSEADFLEISQLLRDGQLPEALTLIKAVQKASPRDPRVWNLLGDYQWRKKNPDECIKAWRKCLELDPRQPRMHDLLARALLGRRTETAENEAALHAEKAIGTNIELAQQFSELFRRPELRERFGAKAAELRTDAAMAKARIVPGTDRTGPKAMGGSGGSGGGGGGGKLWFTK